MAKVLPVGSEERFAFGENWSRFVRLLDDGRIREAEDSLRSMLHADSLSGRSFLDVGCGSGLFSLAAARLGAGPIYSFDFDADSVVCTRAVSQQFFPEKDDWVVEQGDVTDDRFVESLGQFDVVYAWGVLHHTGDMWRAIDNACSFVAPGGALFISIYNSQGRRSDLWRGMKRIYNRVPKPLRVPYALLAAVPLELPIIARATLKRRLGSYVRSWIRPSERGMSRWHDLLDWVGGYPFEVATPEDVFRFCRDRGFTLAELKTTGGGLGCNQFVFVRSDQPGFEPMHTT